MPANRNPSPPRSRPRVRPSGVNAAAVRRLAASRAGAPATDSPPGSAPGSVAGLAAGSALVDAPAPADGAGRTRGRLPWRLIVLAALTVSTLVLGGLAAWFGAEASSLNGQSSAQNLALSDPGETGQVTSQLTSAIGALFSYDYANPAPTRRAAARLLTGAAVGQYSTMIAKVRQDAQRDKLVVTTTVSDIGVEMLTPGTARVLVFATESDGSAGAAAPATAEAMLAVNAVLDGSAWKIEGIDTFGG